MRRISNTATIDSNVSKVQSPLPPCTQQIQSGIKAGFRICAIGTSCQCKLALHGVEAVWPKKGERRRAHSRELWRTHSPVISTAKPALGNECIAFGTLYRIRFADNPCHLSAFYQKAFATLSRVRLRGVILTHLRHSHNRCGAGARVFSVQY